MAFSLKSPALFSVIGSLGIHLVFVVYVGHNIISQDKLVPPPKIKYTLEVVEKKNSPPVEKRKIREVVKKKSTPVPLTRELVPIVEQRTKAVQISAVARVTSVAHPLKHIPAKSTPSFSRQVLVQAATVSSALHSVPIIRPTVSSNSVSLTARGRASTIQTTVARYQPSSIAPKQFQHQQKVHMPSSGGQLIRRETTRANVPLFKARAVQSKPVTNTSQKNGASLAEGRVARIAVPSLAPRTFEKSHEGTKQSQPGMLLVNESVSRIAVSNLGPRTVKKSHEGTKQSQPGMLLVNESVSRVAVSNLGPRTVNVAGGQQEGAAKAALYSGLVARIMTVSLEPRPVPNIIDRRALQGYTRGIQRKIVATKKYPRKAKRQGIEGTVTAKFTVLKSGDIEDLLLVTRTPYKILNDAGLDAIKRSAPFPGLPEEIGQDFLEIVIPFSFTIRN